MPAPTATRRSSTNGWVELDRLPARRTRRRDLNPDAIAEAGAILRRGKAVTDGKGYRTRSAAKWRAERLYTALREQLLGTGKHPAWAAKLAADLERRTWLEGTRWRWAIGRKSRKAEPG